ncbi:sortase [Candidatus Daviesbacteria bacterium]|nr:sortase [Candidatus Daviesbacteria bacterium]
MITTRYYQPGKIVTLYHFRKSRQFRGVLYISRGSKLFNPWGLNVAAQAFLGLATVGFFIVFFPPLYSEVRYQQVIPALAEIPVNDEFFLGIPKINLTANIIPNVDSTNEPIYLEKLKQGIAHAKDSYFPGDDGPVVLFSHSTDTIARIVQYNAKFYALKDLETGDEITINFKGQKYTYRVTEKKIISPEQLDVIRQTSAKLTLTTCWPPGTSWQRLVIFADLSNKNIGI